MTKEQIRQTKLNRIEKALNMNIEDIYAMGREVLTSINDPESCDEITYYVALITIQGGGSDSEDLEDLLETINKYIPLWATETGNQPELFRYKINEVVEFDDITYLLMDMNVAINRSHGIK